MDNYNTVNLLQIKIERAREKLPVETLNAIAAVDWRQAIMKIRQKKGYNFEQLGALETETELLLCGLISSDEYPREVEKRMNISRAETEEIINEMNLYVFRKIKEELIKNTERKKIFEQKKEERIAIEPDPIRAHEGSQRPSASSGMEVKTRPSDGEAENVVLKSAGIEIIKSPVTAPIPDASNQKREELLQKIEHPSPSSIVEPIQDEAKTPRMGDMRTIVQDKILGSVKVPIVKTEHVMENIPNTNTPVVKAPENPDVSVISKKDPYRMSPDE